jgi:hypothetical protein
MNWWVGGSILIVAGLFLRRFLNLGAPPQRPGAGWVPLRAERESVYQPVAQELETQCAILGISLNDAFDERGRGRSEIAWRLVRLCAGEWDRITELLAGLMGAVNKHLNDAEVVVPLRSMSAQRFKSRVMTDYFRMHELLDQLVFRSRTRFQLQVRGLRRAAETLTREFRRAYRYAERTEDRPPEFWQRLDLYYHDLDVLSKESLLAFRTFLACLPEEKLERFTAELEAVLRRRERTARVRVDR